jgi:hypothetical protein
VRPGRPLIAACLAATSLWGGMSGSVAARASQCSGVRTSGHWATIQLPSWPSSDSYWLLLFGIHADSLPPVVAAVDPLVPSRLFLSDGTTMLRSTDGGCSWRSVFTLNPSGVPTDASSDRQPWFDRSYVINSVAVVGGGATAHVYLALTAGVGYLVPVANTNPTYLAASDDGGTSWTVHEIAADGPAGRVTSTAYGSYGHLMASSSAPTTVYWDTVFYSDVFAHSSEDVTLMVSHDGGSTWQVVSVSGPQTAGQHFDRMSEVADAASARVLWRAYDPDKSPTGFDVLRSTNGGRGYGLNLLNQPPGEETFDAPFVTSRPTGRNSCVVAHSAAAAFRTSDIGVRWTRLPSVPGAGAGSGPGYLEGASCSSPDHVVALVGYQPQRYAAPPFARSALYEQVGSGGWRQLASVPVALGEGSLTVAGPPDGPVVSWFGVRANPAHAPPAPSDYVWLRYTGSLGE